MIHIWFRRESQARMTFDSGVSFGIFNAPTPFRTTFHIKAGNVEIARHPTFKYCYINDVFFGDKRKELSVVPEFSARLRPAMTANPQPTGATKTIDREICEQLANSAKGDAKAIVTLNFPRRCKSTLASAEIGLSRKNTPPAHDEQCYRRLARQQIGVAQLPSDYLSDLFYEWSWK
jgi:hypothetical protein